MGGHLSENIHPFAAAPSLCVAATLLTSLRQYDSFPVVMDMNAVHALRAQLLEQLESDLAEQRKQGVASIEYTLKLMRRVPDAAILPSVSAADIPTMLEPDAPPEPVSAPTIQSNGAKRAHGLRPVCRELLPLLNKTFTRDELWDLLVSHRPTLAASAKRESLRNVLAAFILEGLIRVARAATGRSLALYEKIEPGPNGPEIGSLWKRDAE